MNKKSGRAVLIVPLVLLLIPLLGNMFVDGWDWDWPSFVIAWGLMTAAALAYRFVTKASVSVAFRIATCIAILAGLMVVWGNMAVGFIGSEDNPANLLYAIVIAVAIGGAALARFEPAGMSTAILATAIVQFLVPAVALLVRPHDFSPGVLPVFGLNLVFVLMFAGSALLFRRVAREQRASEAHR